MQTAPVNWRTSSFSDGLQCVAIADLGDAVGMRQSKDPDGAILRFSRIDVAAFIEGAKAGEFDDLIA